MYKKNAVWTIALVLTFTSIFSQKTVKDSTFRRHFVGSSGFVIANTLPDPPSFYQLNFGYWLTKKDVISIEAITWKYDKPLGIPYGPSKDSPDEAYPGSVRSYGIGLAYQRYLWKGLYTATHATPLIQKYENVQKEKIQNGFQLFLAIRCGYHIKLFKNNFFLEPSIAFTHWPINTNVPTAFEVKEKNWPNYFLFEPGLHFGLKF